MFKNVLSAFFNIGSSYQSFKVTKNGYEWSIDPLGLTKKR